MNFPQTRLRRLRRTEAIRSLVRETHLRPEALIYPLFICPGEGVRKPIGSMPGVFNLSIDEALKEAELCASLGLGGVLLFGLPAEKDEAGTGAWAEDGIVQTALRAFKRESGLGQAGDDRRCLPVRVHLAWALRHGRRAMGIIFMSTTTPRSSSWRRRRPRLPWLERISLRLRT